MNDRQVDQCDLIHQLQSMVDSIPKKFPDTHVIDLPGWDFQHTPKSKQEYYHGIRYAAWAVMSHTNFDQAVPVNIYDYVALIRYLIDMLEAEVS